jgi:MEMO1 family protein
MVGGGDTMASAAAVRNIRKSAIAGTWYPGTARELSTAVDRFLAGAKPVALDGRLLGVIVPHAGYVYSGQVAAHAYRQLQGLSFDVVAVVSPMHRMYVGPYVVNDANWYETPLGLVEVDRTSIDALATHVPISRVEWDDEHSLEIQLPFLQRILPSFKLVPVMQGDQSLPACERLAESLATVLRGKNALLVASTDLSHFHAYEAAVVLDRVVQGYIEKYDPEGLAQALQAGDAEACGGGPVASVMLAARALGADRAQILQYANSGDVTGDLERVVGYLSAAIYQVD